MIKKLHWLPSCIRLGGDGGGFGGSGGTSALDAAGASFASEVAAGNIEGYGEGSTGALDLAGAEFASQVESKSIEGYGTNIDIGAAAGGILGFLSGVPMGTKLGYELGKKADWNYEFLNDPNAADTYAQDTLSSFEGDRDGTDYKELETTIRTAKEAAAKVPTDAEPEVTSEEQERLDRAARLSSGRGGLLYQGDESGVNYTTKLGGN